MMAEQEKEKFTNTYWDSEGTGRYQDEYDHLAGLAPKRGKADTLAGEIMRAVTKMNHNFYTHGTLNKSADAINFLAMAGVFDGNENSFGTVSLATIYCYVKGSTVYDGTFDGDKVQLAIERINDRAIEFICEYPDLEYTENTMDMSLLRVDFMERVLADHAAAKDRYQVQNISTPSKEAALSLLEMGKEVKMPLQEISTPRIWNGRIANRMASDTAVQA